MRITIIRTDGTEEVHEPERVHVFRWIEQQLAATTLDTVNLRDGRVMFVDDAGYETELIDHGGGHHELRPTRARKPVNARATALYHAVCRPGVQHQIVGDVAIVRDVDFGDEGEADAMVR